MKTGLTPEDALVCYAARRLARPVRWRADRSEDFLAAHMGRDQYNKARLALDADGRILALQVETLGNIGAVPGSPTAGNIVLNGGALQSRGTVTLDSRRGIALGPNSGSGAKMRRAVSVPM